MSDKLNSIYSLILWTYQKAKLTFWGFTVFFTSSYRQLIFLLLVISIASISLASDTKGLFSQGLDVPNYDCQVVLQPAKSLSKRSLARVDFEWAAKTGGQQLLITRDSITLMHVIGSKKEQLKKYPAKLAPGEIQHYTILRRGELLGLMHGENMLFLEKIARGPGGDAIIAADKGWIVEDSSVQRLDPVVFSDDFMRTQDDPGSWKVQSGNWMLQSTWDAIPHGNNNRFAFTTYAQNPFAWLGSCPPGVASAVCTAGETYWEDYRFSVSVCPAEAGAVGMAVNMSDEKNGIFLRWSPVNDRSKYGNSLRLIKVEGGKIVATLAELPGGYIPGQWYRLAMESDMQGVNVFIDGHQRMSIPLQSFWHGAIALYIEGELPAIFDDVTVYGKQVNTDLLKEFHQNGRMENDPNGMAGWSNWHSDWKPANAASAFWMKRPVYGNNIWSTVVLKANALARGDLILNLKGDGVDVLSGYRAVIRQSDNPAQLSYQLFQQNKELASKQVARLNAGEEYTVRFRLKGTALQLEIDDEVVLKAEVTPITGLIPGYSATGALQNISEIIVCGDSIEDYTFASAPVDWVARGVWMPTIRWSCSPNWSFLAGWGRGDTSLFHKSLVKGDQSITAFVGVKMEYARERALYDYRYRDLAVSLCTDGVSPRSGYAGIFPYQESADAPKQIVIMKEGKIVAAKNLSAEYIPERGKNHRTWFELELSRNGSKLDFSVSWLIPNANNPQTLNVSLSYIDPNPLEEGIPAIWTHNNAMSVALARLSHAEPLQPNTKPEVLLGKPWYPEWANVNEPMTIDFATENWSTGNQSLTLQANTVVAPPGNEGDIKVNNMAVTVTPKIAARAGYEESRDAREHWYSVKATDQTAESSSFDIDVQVYDPAIGRSDPKAIVLYRFDEGNGTVVKDRSGVEPTLDLTIQNDEANKYPSASWVPKQGLKLERDSKVVSATVADKLLTLNSNKAGSIEFWASSETLYPRADIANWTSCMLSWDSLTDGGGSKRNLTVGQYPGVLAMIPRNNLPFYQDNNAVQRFGAAHLALQHSVITWKDNHITAYIDGRRVETRNNPGDFTHNIAGSHLILGNGAGFTNAFVGEMYLLAIYNTELTADQVLRNYQAGPSAK